VSSLDTILSALRAFAALAIAVLAIWGDWFRSWLIPPRIEIRPLDLRGNGDQVHERAASNLLLPQSN
jgi:hypothetical protein